MTIARRNLLVALGAVWVVDGLLQLKPAMFTDAFIRHVILPNAQSQPAWVAAPIRWAAGMAAAHIAAGNAFFAAVQLAIGLALIFDYRTRLALVASFAWSFAVWWAGEGFGGLLTGSALAATGAPGAAVFYVLIGVSLWPGEDSSRESPVNSRAFARWSLALLWVLAAGLQLQPAYLHDAALARSFSAGWMTDLIDAREPAAAIAIAAVELAIGIGTTVPRLYRAAAWAGILLSLFFWWVGQGFGGIQTALGTDPNSGPLWVLLTLCAVPNLLSAPRDIDPP